MTNDNKLTKGSNEMINPETTIGSKDKVKENATDEPEKNFLDNSPSETSDQKASSENALNTVDSSGEEEAQSEIETEVEEVLEEASQQSEYTLETEETSEQEETSKSQNSKNAKLSIVIPCYNEQKTLAQVLDMLINLKLPENFDRQIIVVDDDSNDSSWEIIQKYSSKYSFVKGLKNEKNLGKSQSVKRGILATDGDWVVIQDADLEYNPEDIVFMLEQTIKFNCDVGYGNRFGLHNGVVYWKNFLGNVGLSFFSNLFTMWKTRVYIPDMEVCYKLARGGIYRDIAKTIESKSSFGFEPEITAKFSRYGDLMFVIFPIRYNPRSYQEGKKMKAVKDGIKALIEIIKFNCG